MTVNDRRPGVYSRYDVSSGYSAARSSRYAAVVAGARSGGGEVHTVQSWQDAAAVFSLPEDLPMLCAVRLLLGSGVSRVVCAAVLDGGYEAALALVEAQENVGAVVCDCVEAADLALLRDSVTRAADRGRERIAFGAMADPQAAAAAACALQSERVVLCCPAALPRVGGAVEPLGLYTAAAVAGLVLAQDDAAHNFSWQQVDALDQDSVQRLPEETVQELLEAGVTVAEPVGGALRLVRALTTRTRTQEVPDRSLSGLNTILIIDEVMQSVRAALELRLRGGRISTRSLDSIQAQVLVVLDSRRDGGLLEEYDLPVVRSHPEDPAVCVVELSFRVAHVLSQIHVVAHVQV